MKKYIEPSIICRVVVHNHIIATSTNKVSFSSDAISASDADAKFLDDADFSDEDGWE